MSSPSSLLLATVLAALAVTANACGNEARDRVATINGESVTGSEFDAFLSAKLGDISHEPLADSVKSQLFDDFVRRRIIVQEAQRRGVHVEQPDVQVSEPDEPIRAEIATDLLVARYYREVVLRDVTVTSEEVARYYETHRESYKRPKGYYVREIRAASREEAERLRSDIAAQKRDFTAVAREQSAAPTARRGGLSFYETGKLPPVLERAIEPLSVGEMSPVVASSYGYHIFRLESRSGALPLDRVRDEITSEIRTRKNDRLVQAEAERLLGGAHVDIDPKHLRFQYEGRFAKP